MSSSACRVYASESVVYNHCTGAMDYMEWNSEMERWNGIVES